MDFILCLMSLKPVDSSLWMWHVCRKKKNALCVWGAHLCFGQSLAKINKYITHLKAKAQTYINQIQTHASPGSVGMVTLPFPWPHYSKVIASEEGYKSCTGSGKRSMGVGDLPQRGHGVKCVCLKVFKRGCFCLTIHFLSPLFSPESRVS